MVTCLEYKYKIMQGQAAQADDGSIVHGHVKSHIVVRRSWSGVKSGICCCVSCALCLIVACVKEANCGTARSQPKPEK